MATIYEYALISNDVYEEYEDPNMISLPLRMYTWEKVKNYKDSSSGFFARLYKKGKTRETVLAFQGTKPKKPGHLAADIQLATGYEPIGQTYPAEHFYINFVASYLTKSNYPNNLLKFTGHSLGGFIAQFLSVKFQGKRKAIAFNSPGIGGVQGIPSMWDYSYLYNIIERLDKFTKINSQLGNVYTVLSATGACGVNEPLITLPCEYNRHAMDNMVVALRNNKRIGSMRV